MPSPGYLISGKEVEVHGAGSPSVLKPSTVSLPRSPVNPKPCGTFSWPTSKNPFSLFLQAKSLLLPKTRGKKGHTLKLHSPKFRQSCTDPKSPSMAARPRFKSQHQSSSAAPFPTPPTISYTCQHSRIFPALLGCHSKFGQVWPRGAEPIISKLSRRPCNQGKLLPSSTLGGIPSHPPGSKLGHSYLTYP